MTEDILNEIYLLAVKSKLQRGMISQEERFAFIMSELNLGSGETLRDNLIAEPAQDIVQDAYQAQPVSQPEKEESKVAKPEIIGHKYAEQPEDEGFVNRELESEKELHHIYDIQFTNDTSIAYYDLITDSGRNEEYLRSPSMIPENAVLFDNKPTGSVSQLIKVKSGLLNKSGKLWKIVEPCHVKWC